jgi:hypothetical protein
VPRLLLHDHAKKLLFNFSVNPLQSQLAAAVAATVVVVVVVVMAVTMWNKVHIKARNKPWSKT